MDQYSLFKTKLSQVVNVSKVPQLSPFRYPGGKTWLVPWIREWMHSLESRPKKFIEPFAGGGIVSLTIASENYSDHIIMVELDNQISSVWKTILGRNANWLMNEIISFDLNLENAQEAISQKPKSIRNRAFQTIIKNRTFHGGILAKGSGMIKNGENGKGITSRWYPQTLYKRIKHISSIKSKILFIEGDGLEVMRQYSNNENIAFFIDPPYTAGGKNAGKRLYRCSEVNHEEIFQIASSFKGNYLLTYDDSEEVRALANKYGMQYKHIAMQNTHLSKMKELLISNNLSWLN